MQCSPLFRLSRRRYVKHYGHEKGQRLGCPQQLTSFASPLELLEIAEDVRQRLDRHHAVGLVDAAGDLLDGAERNSALVGDLLPPLRAGVLQTADNEIMHRLTHDSENKPFLGPTQPGSGPRGPIRCQSMGQTRRSKRDKTPGTLRTHLADNVNALLAVHPDYKNLSSDTARHVALGKASGMSKSQVQRMLAKEQGISIDYVETLARALGVRPQDLLTPYFAGRFTSEPIQLRTRRRRA